METPSSAPNWIAFYTAQQFTLEKSNMTTLRSTKPNDRSLLRHGYLLLSLAVGFAWLVLAPAARAVSPPPDGGYPNFTTAEGVNALFSPPPGFAQTRLRFFSLFSNTIGRFNTAGAAGGL